MSPSSDAAVEAERWTALPDDHEALTLLRSHYGLPADTFAGHRLWRHRSGTLWLAAEAVSPAQIARVETLGLRLRRRKARPTQVSGAVMRRFFGRASRHVLQLEDGAAVVAYWARHRTPCAAPEGDGYYVVRGPRGWVLGRARVHDGQLEPELSRGDQPPLELWPEL